MNDKSFVHPESIFGPNPFLEALPPPLAYADIPLAMTRNPLENINVMGFSPAMREPLLEYSDQHFVFTSELLEIVVGIQILIRRALTMRNAHEKAERIRVNRIASTSSITDLKKISTLDGAGFLLGGLTGSGKSAVIKRALEIIVPHQVVEHGNSPSCEFYRLKQCYFIYIDLPSNGTRGALLKRILLALDTALDTNYFGQHERTANIDTLLVVVSKLLTIHRVALLVIDENQRDNFADSPWSFEFVLFYLLLMNLGISVALIGNPLAFVHLRELSQVMRRFNTGGFHELSPADIDSEWWGRDFLPGARKFNLVEAWDIEEEWRHDFEMKHCAGIPGIYMSLHKEVMRASLHTANANARVTREDFELALTSPRFKEAARIARSVNSKDPAYALDFTDIPSPNKESNKRDEDSSVNSISRKSSNFGESSKSPELSDSTEKSSAGPEIHTPTSMPGIEKMLSNFKARQTKELNKLKKKIQAMQSLSPEDARMMGTNDELLRAMEEKLATMKSSSETASK